MTLLTPEVIVWLSTTLMLQNSTSQSLTTRTNLLRSAKTTLIEALPNRLYEDIATIGSFVT